MNEVLDEQRLRQQLKSSHKRLVRLSGVFFQYYRQQLDDIEHSGGGEALRVAAIPTKAPSPVSLQIRWCNSASSWRNCPSWTRNCWPNYGLFQKSYESAWNNCPMKKDGTLNKMRILVVEDNPVNLELVLQLLEDDYELLVARDGAEGLEMALKEKPDLILLDLSLPKKSGWEVCQELQGQQIPMVALTAHAIKGDREKALAAGFHAYVTKPIDEDLLFETIEKFR